MQENKRKDTYLTPAELKGLLEKYAKTPLNFDPEKYRYAEEVFSYDLENAFERGYEDGEIELSRYILENFDFDKYIEKE